MRRTLAALAAVLTAATPAAAAPTIQEPLPDAMVDAQPRDLVLPPSPDIMRPNVTRFGITRRVFRIGGLGTVIRWTQSEAATNTIVFHRRVNGRWRRVPRRRMRFESTAGAHRLRFRGRVTLKKPLRPGRYRMTMTARDSAGNVSAPDRARFRLLPRVRR